MHIEKIVPAFFIPLAIVLSACPAAEDESPQIPVTGIALEKNRTPVSGGFTIMEGASVVLSANLLPAGVQGGIYWQSSRTGIVEISAGSGHTVTVTGVNGGDSIITVLARNIRNEVYAETSLTVTVIPTSFFKWNSQTGGWDAIPANANGMAGGMIVRAVGQAVDGDRNGLTLNGSEGVCLVIGSGMGSATNSPFVSLPPSPLDDPVYDKAGRLNFLDGPSPALGSWNGRVRISVDYELKSVTGQAGKFLRLQVNNNTTAADNASAIDNWLAAELPIPLSLPVRRSGTLTGVFDGTASRIVKDGVSGLTAEEKLRNVLSRSFAAISLSPGGGIVLIKNIKIEAD